MDYGYDIFQNFGTAGANETFATFWFLVLLALGCAFLLLASRHMILPVLLIATLFLPMKQRLVLFGLDFTAMRFLLICGLIRIATLGEHRGLTLNKADRLMRLLVIVMSVVYIILRHDLDAIVNRCGFALDVLGIYFIFRILLRSEQDYRGLARALAAVCIVLAALMSIEYLTGNNPLAFIGAIRDVTQIREERLRCQAAFAHPILAGNTGAVLFPIFVALWRSNMRGRILYGLAIIGSALIVFLSGSSGPVMTLVGSGISLLVWPARRRMKMVRRTLVAGLILLQLSMKAPIWALVGRVSIIGGSTGYHRYKLFDAFINNMSEWWLLGTVSTFGWGFFLFDVANQYVGIGVDGGLASLTIAICLWVCLFSTLGKALAISGLSKQQQFFIWSLGCSLVGLLVSYMGVAYYDQSRVILYMIYAACAGVLSAFSLPTSSGKEGDGGLASSGYAVTAEVGSVGK